MPCEYDTNGNVETTSGIYSISITQIANVR